MAMPKGRHPAYMVLSSPEHPALHVRLRVLLKHGGDRRLHHRQRCPVQRHQPQIGDKVPGQPHPCRQDAKASRPAVRVLPLRRKPPQVLISTPPAIIPAKPASSTAVRYQ